MNKSALVALPLFFLAASVSCFSKDLRPPLSFLMPGGTGRDPNEKAPIKVVVEDGFISYENRPVPPGELIPYLNGMLENEKSSSLAVYIRTGLRFGAVVKALDELRQTEAKAIGVSMIELGVGQTL